jgi:phosphopantetheinyl transferase
LIFSRRERLSFHRVRSEKAAFLTGWTRKEAILKALGVGLTEASRAEVDFSPVARRPIIAIDGSRAAAKRWKVFDFRLAEDTWGALATAPRRDS